MNEAEKKLEAVGDGLLLACARLYLRSQHRDVPYSLYTRLTVLMVSNRTLAVIAQAEGIHRGQDGAADAFEREIARYYFTHGFRDTKHWLWMLFDKHLDIPAEVQRLTDPDEAQRLMKLVRGSLKSALKLERQQVSERAIEIASKQIVASLKNGYQS